VSGWLPSPDEELLLQAALGSGEDVARSWSEWRGRVNLDDVTATSFRLLPLTYVNLLEHGVDDPDLGRLKGIYRQAWVRAQLQQRGLAEALRLLADAGIETMLLKGSALLQRVYPTPAARPMEDLDVLVHPEQLRRAVDGLVAGGWRISRADGLPDSRIPLVHAVHLRRQIAEWINLDLHRRAMAARDHADDDFWATAEPLEVGGVPTRMPSPTHLFLATLVRASQTPGPAQVRWVPDATLILRRFEIDWDQLVRDCERRRFTLSVAIGLRYLQGRFGAIPPTAIERIEQVRAPRYERRELAARMHQTGRLTGLEFHVRNYRCLTGELPAWQRALRFPGYLRDWWGLESTWSVPVEGARRLVTEMRAQPPTTAPESQLDAAR
jgi:hypothetical protein